MAAVLASGVFVTRAGAQEGALGTGGLKGIVRDSMGLGIVGVEVTFPNSSLRAETDEKGEFVLAKVTPGILSMRFRRLGFRPDTVELMILAGKSVPLDVTLARLAVDLAPVVVVGRATLTGWRAGFYQRRGLGTGFFFTKDDIEKRNPGMMTDMFRSIPGAHVEPSRGIIQNRIRFRSCRTAPLTWLDGSPLAAGEFDLDAISPRSIEAVEVYAGAAMAPPQYRVSPAISSACGTILLWSREGEARAKRRKGNVSAATELAQRVEKREVYTSKTVDVAARADQSKLPKPAYPNALFEAGIGGSVMAEYVVDAAGQVDLDSFSLVFATHPSFVDAVRDVLKDFQYTPAIVKGYPVAQVVQHEFKFVPDQQQVVKKP